MGENLTVRRKEIFTDKLNNGESSTVSLNKGENLLL